MGAGRGVVASGALDDGGGVCWRKDDSVPTEDPEEVGGGGCEAVVVLAEL